MAYVCIYNRYFGLALAFFFFFDSAGVLFHSFFISPQGVLDIKHRIMGSYYLHSCVCNLLYLTCNTLHNSRAASKRRKKTTEENLRKRPKEQEENSTRRRTNRPIPTFVFFGSTEPPAKPWLSSPASMFGCHRGGGQQQSRAKAASTAAATAAIGTVGTAEGKREMRPQAAGNLKRRRWDESWTPKPLGVV